MDIVLIYPVILPLPVKTPKCLHRVSEISQTTESLYYALWTSTLHPIIRKDLEVTKIDITISIEIRFKTCLNN